MLYIPSIVGAIDFLFKMIHTLDLPYPETCPHVWSILQDYIYEMQDLTKRGPRPKTIKEFHANFCNITSCLNATIEEAHADSNAEYSNSFVSLDGLEKQYAVLRMESSNSVDFISTGLQNSHIALVEEISSPALHFDAVNIGQLNSSSCLELLPGSLKSANNDLYESSKDPTDAFLSAISNDSGIRTDDDSLMC